MAEMPPARGRYSKGTRRKQGIPKGSHVNKTGRIVANKGKRTGTKVKPRPKVPPGRKIYPV